MTPYYDLNTNEHPGKLDFFLQLTRHQPADEASPSTYGSREYLRQMSLG